jgi:hypothetical protein
MKKHQSKSKPKPKQNKEEKAVTLGDLLNADLVNKLKNTQKELKEQEEKKREQEEQRKKEEKRLKDKNKSFEELLSESAMNWKEFK